MVFWKRVFPMEINFTFSYWIYAGFMLDKDPAFGIIWALLMTWEIMKKGSD